MKKNILKIALSALLVMVVLVGSTLAFLATQTDVLANTFAIVDIDTEVVEDPSSGDASSKKPMIQNNSNVPVYVRAYAVVSTDKDSPVSVSSENVRFTYSSEWKQDGDYYYYMQPLQPGDTTPALFKGVDVTGLDETARFSVYVYHESVQAKDTSLTNVADIAALFN